MRLIEKSISRNLFESLKEDRVIEAINAAFYGTDFVVNYIDSIDDYNVTVGISALSDSGEELSRDIGFEFPNTDFDSVYEVCDEWISSHNSPDLFYESVMINTGSTTITSDETGVVVEDNGNTITVGNGVTVDVDNEADVLPAEMDLAAPVDEVPADIVADVPAEDIENAEPVEECVVRDSSNHVIKGYSGKSSNPVEHFKNVMIDIDRARRLAEEIRQEAYLVGEAVANQFNGQELINWEDFRDAFEMYTNEINPSLLSDENLHDFEMEVRDVLSWNYGYATIYEGEYEGGLTTNSDMFEAVEVMVNEPMKDKGVNLADSKAITKDEEELTEAIDKDGGPFPYLMKHGQGPGTLPKDVKIVKYGESSNGKDIVYLDKVLTAEEEAKFEMTPMSNLQDDNLNEAEQSIDIFANPEFDYKITDITVLQPTDSGDVRAIDMNDILVGLDEALTERYGNASTVTLNSYLTKHGKDYSSAIVDVSAPNFKGYVYTFESSFDGRLYDCVIKETATNKRLEHLCVKSADPVKPFVNAIVEAINVSYRLSEHSSISEDIELLVNRDKVEDNNGVTYTDDVRVKEHNDHIEDNMKDKEKKLKPKKKFEVGKEPDQKNTRGEEIAKTNLKETEENLVDKLTALKAKLNDNSADLDTIASELDIACDEAGYDRLWEEGLVLMELVREHIQKAMAEDFDNGKSMLKHLDNTDAQYAYVDGYANYRNLDKDILENMIDDIISDLSINESAEGNSEFMSSDIEAGDVVPTRGVGDVEVLDINKNKNYILVKRGKGYQPFVAAWNPELVDGKLTWGQGHYFDNEEDAREYFNKKLNEAEELVDETPLAEDINPRAVFHRKPSSVAEMRAAEENGLVTNKSSYIVVNTKELNSKEFEEFSNNLLRDYDWLEELYTTDEVDSGVFRCIEVINVDNNESILVDPSGYTYARYAALKTPVETIAEEPVDEVIE